MRLSRHQWLVVIGIAAVFVVVVGVLAAVPPDEGGGSFRLPLSTSTPTPALNIGTTAWWDSVPTAARVPTMPHSTETQPPTPSIETNTTP